jgi:Flp pilus assembly protein TadG
MRFGRDRRSRRRRQAGQSLVEFSLTVGLLMLLAILVAQVAIYLHYRSSLDLATKEGAFEASLVGHQPADGEAETRQMWTKLEPGGGWVKVSASQQGDFVVVSASAVAPAILPMPFPPYTALPVSSRSVHTVERFQPGPNQ